MAETVGSVMGNHIGKGRYLTADNFGKELYLGECFGILVTYSDPEFNLGPLFLLHNLAERMLGLRKRDYLYRRKAHNGPLSSHFSRLANHEEGAAVSILRKVDVDKAHLPVKLWQF